MTLIAVFTTTSPVLLSDVLLSSNQPNIPATTPMGVPIDPAIYDTAPLRPLRFQQKTAILYDGKIAVAVAGDFTRARQAVCKLRDDARAGRVDQAGLQAWCSKATEQFSGVSLIIVWAEGQSWVVGRIGNHMIQKSTASGAVVHFTGSGTSWLRSSTVSLGSVVEQINVCDETDETDRPIVQAIGQSGMQLFSERSIGVHDNFGGGCQITHMFDGRFYHVRSITYLHWSIFHTPKGAPYQMEFFPVIVRQRQHGFNLVFETIQFDAVEFSQRDGWSEYHGRVTCRSVEVAPLITGTTPAPAADHLEDVSYYHLQRVNYWKESLVDFRASVILHAGDVASPVQLDTSGDEVSVRVRSDVLMAWRRQSKISKKWKYRERMWAEVRARSRAGN